MDIVIPRKSHFQPQEVSSLTGVKPYVLRFWENEFENLAPVVSATGHKVYKYEDIENILAIKKCLFDDKMSIEDAKNEISIQASNEEVNFYETENEEIESHSDNLIKAKDLLQGMISKLKTTQDIHNWH